MEIFSFNVDYYILYGFPANKAKSNINNIPDEFLKVLIHF